MMWFLLLLLYTAHNEPLVVQGENRIILKDGSNPCEGYIGIYHDGVLGYVGDTNWNMAIEEVVCRSTHCGKPQNSATNVPPWPIDTVGMNEVNCTGQEDQLWNCKYPGWKVSYFRKGSLKKITCSNDIKIRLDGQKCAGAVQYSTDGGKTYSGYFCEKDWGVDQANLLCKKLDCGAFKEIPKHSWIASNSFKGSEKKGINCKGVPNVTDLWQCATHTQDSCKNPASVVCTGHERVQLRGDASNVCSGQLETEENGTWNRYKNNETDPDLLCKQMHCGKYVTSSHDDDGTQLTCRDNVKVVLMDGNNPSSCYGTVNIEVDNRRRPVCGTDWNKENAEVVCRELGCGSVVRFGNGPDRDGMMDNVQCLGSESSLWHCRAKHNDNPSPCRTAKVVCAESVNVRLMDGLSKCAGRVEIQHEGKWQRVRKLTTWSNTNSDVVCKHIGCGNKSNSANSEKFSKGSADFLKFKVNCDTNAKLSQCIEGESTVTTPDEAVGITCEGHKVVFLKGECSGMVGIEHGDKIHWLSGSEPNWNKESANTVCRQTQCGNATSNTVISNADMSKDVWAESYNCSADTNSLFDCEKGSQSVNHTNTVAHVTCSGNIQVNLTNSCWGTVKVCMNGKCGGVCADTWTTNNSEMLCKDLNCLEVLHTNTKPERSEVIFKSVHTTKETTSLRQCNFVINGENDEKNTCDPAYVVCSGSVQFKLDSYRDKCSGNVAVQYEGQWLRVCKETLEHTNTQNTICEELKCGDAAEVIDFFGPREGGDVIKEIQFGEKSLTPHKIKSEKPTCELGGLKCSNWSMMALSKGDKACSGAVFVHSEQKKSAICFERWTESEGERLCTDLKCGKLKSNYTTTSDVLWTTNFSCGDKPKNIWDCEKETFSSKESQSKHQLFVECQDEPKIKLSESCHGELTINDTEVCAKHWKDTDSDLVCQEKGCGNAVKGAFRGKTATQDQQYHHVHCEKNHYPIGQCKRFLGTCDGHLVSVNCVRNIIFNTTEKCGGQIEVNYGNKWRKVCPLKSELKEMLCKELNCSGHNRSILPDNYNESLNLETTLECTEVHLDIKYCVKKQSCGKVKPAEIYCNGYEGRPPPIMKPTTTPIVLIILGVGFLLVLVILIIIFLRICIFKRAKTGKNAMNVSSRMSSRKDVEFESGNFEDVIGKASEMEELNRGMFISESEVITENDARSTSSFPYDDIDDMAQPLTPQASTAGADYVCEDGVTYEVDDPQENYDDIEAPDMTQTKAEVHDGPQTTPESHAAQVSVLGDEDYLVPDQDGRGVHSDGRVVWEPPFVGPLSGTLAPSGCISPVGVHHDRL